MREIKLIKISLENWRAQNRDVVFNGEDATISGRNKSGKSSVYDAFLWALTGYDSSARSNFELFDNKVEQTPDNSKKAIVEVVLDVEGEEVKFRREAEIGWVRKRNTSTYERGGSDNYKYFVDDIENSAKMYNERIERVFNASMEKIKVMLNITYFLSLDWRVMRKNLQDIIGEITDSDFKNDYKSISKLLKEYTTEEVKEQLKSQMRPIKANIASLPDTIEALEASISDGLDEEPIRHKIARLKVDLKDAEENIEAYFDKFIKPNIEKRNALKGELSLAKDRMYEARRSHSYEESSEVKALREELYAKEKENEDVIRRNNKRTSERKDLERDAERLRLRVSYYEKEHEKLQEENRRCKEREFAEDSCRYCGQSLPKSMLEEAKAKFNAEKEREHSHIVEKGKLNRVQLEKTKEELQKVLTSLELSSDEQEKLHNLADIKERIAILSAEKEVFEQTPTYAHWSAKIKELSAKIEEVDVRATPTALLDEKRAIQDKLEELNRELGKAEEQTKQKLRALRMRNQLKEETIQLAELEGKLNSVVEYERERAQIISDRVNHYFDFVKVEMTEIRKDGELADTCRILDKDGVNVAVTNTASKAIAGIDICSAFARYYDVCPPLWVDNAESINDDNFPYSAGQTIKIKATEDFFSVEQK